jgi:hypothetical protein
MCVLAMLAQVFERGMEYFADRVGSRDNATHQYQSSDPPGSEHTVKYCRLGDDAEAQDVIVESVHMAYQSKTKWQLKEFLPNTIFRFFVDVKIENGTSAAYSRVIQKVSELLLHPFPVQGDGLDVWAYWAKPRQPKKDDKGKIIAPLNVDYNEFRGQICWPSILVDKRTAKDVYQYIVNGLRYGPVEQMFNTLSQNNTFERVFWNAQYNTADVALTCELRLIGGFGMPLVPFGVPHKISRNGVVKMNAPPPKSWVLQNLKRVDAREPSTKLSMYTAQRTQEKGKRSGGGSSRTTSTGPTSVSGSGSGKKKKTIAPKK